MYKIYSKVNPDTLLHAINRLEDISPGRTDIAPEEQFIQLSALNMEKGKTLPPPFFPSNFLRFLRDLLISLRRAAFTLACRI